MVGVYCIIGTDRHGSRSQPKPEKTMVKYKHEAENAISTAVYWMEMIIRKEPHLGANDAAVEKAQLKIDSLVQLQHELTMLDGVVLPTDLVDRIVRTTFRAAQLFGKPNA